MAMARPITSAVLAAAAGRFIHGLPAAAAWPSRRGRGHRVVPILIAAIVAMGMGTTRWPMAAAAEKDEA